jgi:hypothetical protein
MRPYLLASELDMHGVARFGGWSIQEEVDSSGVTVHKSGGGECGGRRVEIGAAE